MTAATADLTFARPDDAIPVRKLRARKGVLAAATRIPGPDAADLFDPDTGFGVRIDFPGGLAMLTVTGEVDLSTAPELGAILEAVIDRGHHSLVLNLSELTFMDAAGLGVIANTSRRLGLYGAMLTIRSPSPLVRRILDITGLATAVHLEPPEEHAAASTVSPS